MRPLQECPPAVLRAVRGVFFDIDDTLTTHGKLTADAYTALERLQTAGIVACAITGRPAGWCDHITRMWPVQGVVGENGAFWFYRDAAAGKLVRRFLVDEPTRVLNRSRLTNAAARVLREVPGTALASDQPYREADIAIDFCEDVPPLPREAVERIKVILEEEGLTAKISSIHVNAWLGEYDKLTTTRQFAREVLGCDLEQTRVDWLYLGDSPNDEPMFRWFPNAVGVANVMAFADRLQYPPAWVTNAPCGAGFAEAVDRLLAARAG